MDIPVLLARLIILAIYVAFFWGIFSYSRENGVSMIRAVLSGIFGAATFTALTLIGMSMYQG